MAGSGSRGRPGWRASKLVVVKRMMALESDSTCRCFSPSAARRAAQPPPRGADLELGRGNYYIAMEYLDVENLSLVRRTARRSRGRCRTCSARLVADVAEETTTRTPAASSRACRRRTIIVTFDGGIKVVDFGIARSPRSHHVRQAEGQAVVHVASRPRRAGRRALRRLRPGHRVVRARHRYAPAVEMEDLELPASWPAQPLPKPTERADVRASSSSSS